MLSSPRINTSELDKNGQTLLNEQLDWLTVDHDDLRQDLLERIATPKYHPSMAIIDQWEKEAIARIRHSAVYARRALIIALDEHALQVKQTLDTLTPKLREARHGNKPFNKKDLQEWATQLHELKQMPMIPVINDQETIIHGLTIDLPHSASILNTLEHPISSSISTNKTTRNKKKPDVDNTSSNRSYAMSSGRMNIVTKPTEIQPMVSHRTVRRAHTNTPVDSRINESLREPVAV